MKYEVAVTPCTAASGKGVRGDRVRVCNEVSLRTCLLRHRWDVEVGWKVCHILVQ
jgi:hypothetical protein